MKITVFQKDLRSLKEKYLEDYGKKIDCEDYKQLKTLVEQQKEEYDMEER